MIEGVSESTTIEEEQQSDMQLATVGTVYSDGLTLIFDGQTEETLKHYKCNTSVAFQAGDRVKVARISGSYIVEYVVGAPSASGGGTSELVNGDYKITLDANGNLVPTGDVKIGTLTNTFAGLCAGGFVSPSKSLVGFYGGIGTIQSSAIYKTISSANQVAALQTVMNQLISIGILK